MNTTNSNSDYSQVESLETAIKEFAEKLPYWAKYLAKKILSENTISDNDIDNSYSYLLENLKLKEETQKPDISINCNSANTTNYKSDLFLTKLENVEGVNALVENQTIEFSPNLTIIYGANGSGKSGYVRLLKNVFYSKAPEKILQNVHIDSGHKSVSAKFTFKSNDTEIPLNNANKDNVEFKQFAVFDGKSAISHLEQKNEFEFRPSGLNFFANYTNAIKRVEDKLNVDIQGKSTQNDFSILFDGDSEIKTFVQNLNAQTKFDDIKRYTPFSDEDKTKKEDIQKKSDDLRLILSRKNEEILKLENIKKLLTENKTAIERLNQIFTTEALVRVKAAINDCLTKEVTAKNEGIENFKTDKIQGIGTVEWKNFIISAETFAKKQNIKNNLYLQKENNCLFCLQPLSEDAEKLIANYWIFIKSVAEQNAKKALETLNNIKQKFEQLNFDLFPANNTLTTWLTEKYPNELETLKQTLSEQKALAQNIISDIQNKTVSERVEIKIDIEQHTIIETAIDASIKSLKEDEQNKELDNLLKTKTFLEHKEKFNTYFSKFEIYVDNQVWIKKAKKADFAKRKITDTEKNLSNKFFNQKYIDNFNSECKKLNGSFGIEINHTGSAGKSYRQLKLKGNSPNTILSEGEQKVIAIADFLAEMQLSEINRGFVFDDPVNSLDNDRKKQIAQRLASQATAKQVIVFTHDLVFVSDILTYSENSQLPFLCHWIENRNNNPGQIWLENAPCYEKKYRNAELVKKIYLDCNNNCPPTQREMLLKQGFAALRTCYEVLVINELFCNVVQRYNERVSVDSLSKVIITDEIKNELADSFAQCCRYMEGHTHSDKYAYQQPEPINLNEEILRYESIRKIIKDAKKTISINK
ncbi:MAG: AAA family ATPase [Chitinispirillales bacterium]|jgi:energy-coupling factor transporter ATP-binding protein EcfA2|nr:AAA family ATPase [Chitinispirillales bacterium]